MGQYPGTDGKVKDYTVLRGRIRWQLMGFLSNGRSANVPAYLLCNPIMTRKRLPRHPVKLPCDCSSVFHSVAPLLAIASIKVFTKFHQLDITPFSLPNKNLLLVTLPPRASEATAAALHAKKSYLIVGTDPLALTLMKPPSTMGADIVVGTAQRFGVPMWCRRRASDGEC